MLNDILPTEIKKFFTEWVRKMVHARLAEFVKCYTITCKESKGEHVKGGQTLRDKLYKFEKKFSSTSRNPKKRSQKSSGNVINNKYTACDYQKKSKNQADTRRKRKRGKINLNLTRTTNIIEKHKSKKQSLNITTTLPKKKKAWKSSSD